MNASTKPGVKTSEFWLAVLALAATIAHTLGLSAVPQGDLQHGFSAACLAIVTTWLGSNYMAVRLNIKSESPILARVDDLVSGQLKKHGDAIAEKLRDRVEAAVKAEPANPATPPAAK